MATAAFLNQLADAAVIDTISLHTGDPGVAGTANEVSGSGYTREAASFAAASGGVRALSAAVDFDGPAAATPTYIGLWSGATFLDSEAITSPLAFNAEGKLRLTTATTITVSKA